MWLLPRMLCCCGGRRGGSEQNPTTDDDDNLFHTLLFAKSQSVPKHCRRLSLYIFGHSWHVVNSLDRYHRVAINIPGHRSSHHRTSRAKEKRSEDFFLEVKDSTWDPSNHSFTGVTAWKRDRIFESLEVFRWSCSFFVRVIVGCRYVASNPSSLNLLATVV